MDLSLEQKGRHVVPRWRDVRTTGALGELDPASAEKREISERQKFLEEKEAEWNENKRLFFATDMIGAALALGDFERADESAKFILDHKQDASSAAVHAAQMILNRGKEVGELQPPNLAVKSSLQGAVRFARARLHEDPRNAIAWTDLSRAYASLGLSEKAERCMRLAVSLGGANRFVIRSATRLCMHFGRKVQAHEGLKRNPGTPYDPWLLAAEIASAQLVKKTSRFIKTGLTMLTSGNYPPFHLAELAAAIGSLELAAGKSKSAKKLFRTALIKPTDNSLAQIEWASTKLTDFAIGSNQFSAPFSHEARARYGFNVGDWKSTVDESRVWLADEPFSSSPAALGSYVAGDILGDFVLSEQICRDGLIASRNDPTLLNNLAFSLTHQERLSEARAALKEIDRDKATAVTEICITATEGLLEFREGNAIAGRIAYENAIAKASRSEYSKLRAHAALNLAQEEFRVSSNEMVPALTRAVDYCRSIRDADLRAVLERLSRILEGERNSAGEIDRVIAELRELTAQNKPPLITPVKTSFDDPSLRM